MRVLASALQDATAPCLPTRMTFPGTSLTFFGTIRLVDSLLRAQCCQFARNRPSSPPTSSTPPRALTQGTNGCFGQVTLGTSLWRLPRAMAWPPTLFPHEALQGNPGARLHGSEHIIQLHAALHGLRSGHGPDLGIAPSRQYSRCRFQVTLLAGQERPQCSSHQH